MTRCRCPCHRSEVDAVNPDWCGPETTDFMACVSACETCRWMHGDVMRVGYERRIRTLTLWVDPPPSQADATGDKRRRNRRLTSPALPSAVFSIVGPVPVIIVANLRDHDGTDLLGKWCPDERCIKLCADRALVTQWITLFHEWLHVAQWDAGTGVGEVAEERVCDSLSSFLFAAGVRL